MLCTVGIICPPRLIAAVVVIPDTLRFPVTLICPVPDIVLPFKSKVPPSSGDVSLTTSGIPPPAPGVV